MGVRIVVTTTPWKFSRIFTVQICQNRMSIIRTRASYGQSIKLRIIGKVQNLRIRVFCMFLMLALTNLVDSMLISMAVCSRLYSSRTPLSDLLDISNTLLRTISSCCSHKMRICTRSHTNFAGLPLTTPTKTIPRSKRLET